MKRKGRGLKMLGALAGAEATKAVTGLAVRAAGKMARTAMRRYGMKAAAAGAVGAGTYTALRQMAATQKRATAKAGVKRVNAGDLSGVAKKLKFGTSRQVKISGTEYKTYKFNVGRKRPMTVKRLSKVTTQRRVYRFQNIAPIDRTGVDRGGYWLNTIVTTDKQLPWSLAASTAGSFADQPIPDANRGSLQNGAHFLGAPVNLFLLNGTRDRVSGGVDIAYRLWLGNDDNGNVFFEHMRGTTPDPNAAGGISLERKWTKEYSSHDFGALMLQDEKVRYIQNDWYDIKLCLRNATNQRTFFEVSIVQFTEDYLDPLGSPANTDDVRERHAFWYGVTRRHTNHPLQTDRSYQTMAKKIKVLKRVRVEMDAKLSVETDQAPNFKVVKLFYRDGTINDYANTPNVDVVGITTADQLLNPNIYEPQGTLQTQYDTVPRPKARKWLMITAFDPTINATASNINPVSGTWGSIANDPSYDIIIRKKETRFPDFSSA